MNIVNTETPPPPPPKPGSHEASRGGTPHSVPAPGHQPEQQEPNNQHPQLPNPPAIEEGWLPDIVKDKS